MTSAPARNLEVENHFIWENRYKLRNEYGGKWVAIEAEAIIAADEDEQVTARKARDAGVSMPYIVFMKPIGAPSVFIAPLNLP